jgi:hypothetical protein
VEALRLGLASPQERRFIEQHQSDCAACRALVDSLAAAHQEFASEVLPRTRATLWRRWVQQHRRARLWFAGLLVPATAGLVLALVQVRRDEGPLYATKGSPTLSVAARRGALVFRPDADHPVRPHDQIRFQIRRTPSAAFVLIASVDGAGRPNIYVPYEGRRSQALPMGDPAELPGSIILDASPGPERIFALLSAAPLDADLVRRALARIGAGGAAAIRETSRLDVGVSEQTSVLLEKELP